MSSKKLIVIHGVNFFDEERVVADVRKAAKAWNVPDSNILTFNWDILTGDPLAQTVYSGINTRFLSELGAGMLNAAHLGFFKKPGRSALGCESFLWVHNALVFPLQLISPLFIPLTVLVAIMGGSKVWLASYASLVLIPVILGAYSASRPVVLQCFRRSCLVATWGIASGILAPFILPGITVWFLIGVESIGLLKFRGMLTLFGLQTQSLNFFGDTNSFVWAESLNLLVVLAALLCVMGLIAAIRRTPLGILIKIAADTFRYIGLMAYRNDMLVRLHKLVSSSLADSPEELIFLTHSLGSVIATDYLLHADNFLTEVPVTLITMGSPLRRWLPVFFPSEYNSPSATFLNIRSIVHSFRWINLYRQHDPVGCALGDGREGVVDILLRGPTETRGRFIKITAHADYWSSMNPQIEAALKSTRLNRRPQGPSWKEPPFELPLDPYLYGWNNGRSIGTRLWNLRRSTLGVVSRRVGVARTVLACVLLYAISIFISAAGEQHTLRVKITEAELLADAFIAVLILPEIWLWAVLPFCNFALACYPFFGGPILISEEIQRSNSRRFLFSIAAIFLVCVGLSCLQLTPVSSWQTLGTIDLDGQDNAGEYGNLVAVDKQTVVVGVYPGAVRYTYGGYRTKWQTSGTNHTLGPPVLSYDPASQCLIAADRASLSYGKLYKFPAQMTIVNMTQIDGDPLSVGSDCRTATVATYSSVYVVHLESQSTQLLTLANLGVQRKSAGFAVVVSPDGSNIGVCNDDAWLIDVGAKSAVQTGHCVQDLSMTTVGFDPTGQSMWWIDSSNIIGLAGVKNGAIQRRIFNVDPLHEISTAALSPSGGLLAVADNGEVRIYDVRSLRPLAHHANGLNTGRPSQLLFLNSADTIGVADRNHGRLTVFRWRSSGLKEKIMKAFVWLGLRGDESDE